MRTRGFVSRLDVFIIAAGGARTTSQGTRRSAVVDRWRAAIGAVDGRLAPRGSSARAVVPGGARGDVLVGAVFASITYVARARLSGGMTLLHVNHASSIGFIDRGRADGRGAIAVMVGLVVSHLDGLAEAAGS